MPLRWRCQNHQKKIVNMKENWTYKKLKDVTINQSIAETQKLFDYMMDKYFG